MSGRLRFVSTVAVGCAPAAVPATSRPKGKLDSAILKATEGS
jgi:hypothetical protein